jgi:hypothetical protein
MRRATAFLAALAALGLGACGSSTAPVKTVTVTNTVTTGTHAATTATAPAQPILTVHLSDFQTPSHNIGCMLIGGVARCDIRARTWSPPPHPASCSHEVDFGQGLEVGASGPAGFVCAGDTALDPSASVLPYGTRSVFGQFSCVSRTTGISCTNTSTGHGFEMSRSSYALH